MALLTELTATLSQTKPYQGLRILHNIPLTMEAVLKIEPLLAGGAEVTMSCINTIEPSTQAIQFLHDINITVDLAKKDTGDYDLYLDCCAELAHLKPPRLGTIELTQTGSELYKNKQLTYPVISVDDSIIKIIENFYGTAEGFIKGFTKLTQADLDNKKFIIFGCGRVGKGIVNALLLYTKQLVLVDKQAGILRLGNIQLPVISIIQLDQIKIALADAFCVITCTGQKDFMSQYFEKRDISSVYLANIGIEDEYGPKFAEADVLFAKRAINFCADSISQMKYLDPVFYAHNSAIDLLLTKQFTAGYHALPESDAQRIMHRWESQHGVNTQIALQAYL